ncbi:MAG: dTDP-4-dehydrorhamnose reductase [Phycisphaerae bacterium]
MDLFDRVMVLGAGGMLGRQVVSELKRRGRDFCAFGHSEVDIAADDAVRSAFDRVGPTLVFNCAAFTRVDDCEAAPDRAMSINGEAPGALARLAAETNALLVHISSDYVFPGTGRRPYREDDPTAPDDVLSAYGRTKLEGDRRILASGCRHLIARTSWVYGPGGPNFVDTITRAAGSQPELKVVDDQRGRPTYTVDLAAGIFSLLDRGAEGVVNVANDGECTWYDFACEILRLQSIPTPVRPCTTQEFPRPARRPAFSVLDLSRFQSIVGQPLRTWREAVGAHLRAHEAPEG